MLSKYLGLTFFTLSVFAVTLIWTAPLSLVRRFYEVPPQVEALSGTLFAGQIDLAEGLVLNWDTRARSLLVGRLDADFNLAGPATRLDGLARAGFTKVGVASVQGRLGPEMLDLIEAVPGTRCEGQTIVAIDRLTWGRSAVDAQGQVRVRDGVCTPQGQAPVPVPALRVDLTSEAERGLATVVTDDAAATRLGSLSVAPDRWLRLRVEPEGARLVPGMPSSAPTEIEMPF